MALTAEELFEAGLNLPPSLRRALALRLLESVEVVDESINDEWADEIASRIDYIRSGKVKTVPGEEVMARLVARRAERQAAREK